MPCPRCGQPTDPASRFCPHCGAPLTAPSGPASATPRPPLTRPRSGRMIAGVCAAIARTYGWNVTLIRVLLVVLTPLHLGLGFLAYLVGWIAIPEEPIYLPPAGRV